MTSKKITKKSGEYDIDLDIQPNDNGEIIDVVIKKENNVERKLKISRNKKGGYSLLSRE